MLEVLVWAILLPYPLFVAVREGVYGYRLPTDIKGTKAQRIAVAAYYGMVVGIATLAGLVGAVLVVVRLIAG
jgi:hypothetical protein